MTEIVKYSNKQIDKLISGIYDGEITVGDMPESLYYAIADYLPARLGGFSAGGFAGAATGYITDPLLVGGLTARYEASRFGAAVRYLPQKGEGTVAVYALEFSYAL